MTWALRSEGGSRWVFDKHNQAETPYEGCLPYSQSEVMTPT